MRPAAAWAPSPSRGRPQAEGDPPRPSHSPELRRADGREPFGDWAIRAANSMLERVRSVEARVKAEATPRHAAWPCWIRLYSVVCHRDGGIPEVAQTLFATLGAADAIMVQSPKTMGLSPRHRGTSLMGWVGWRWSLGRASQWTCWRQLRAVARGRMWSQTGGCWCPTLGLACAAYLVNADESAALSSLTLLDADHDH